MGEKYYKQKQKENANSINNLKKQQNTSYSMPNTGKRTINKEAR
jgi:hypothetical protein